MPALKLFISHSSLLDELDAQGQPLQRNWDLMKGVCDELRNAYGGRIEILVDIEGLLPAIEWRARLDDWLAECDAAVILFSKRAIEESDWVKFEAAVLRWRASRDAAFKLVPVVLPDEADPDDLENDFWKTVDIARRQCIRDASSPAEIVGKLRNFVLGDLVETEHQTCFGKRLRAVRTLIAECSDSTRQEHGESLRAAWEALTDQPPPSWPVETVPRYALGLARLLLDEPDQSLKKLDAFLVHIHPPLRRPRELLEYVRPMWVSAEAAENFLRLEACHALMMMNGDYVTQPELDAAYYTFERYLERAQLRHQGLAWIASSPSLDASVVRDELRTLFDKRWETYPVDKVENRVDRRIRDSDKPVIALIAIDGADAIDGRRLDALRRLKDELCPRLIVVLAPGGYLPEAIPPAVKPVRPALDLDYEYDRLQDEREVAQALPAR